MFTAMPVLSCGQKRNRKNKVMSTGLANSTSGASRRDRWKTVRSSVLRFHHSSQLNHWCSWHREEVRSGRMSQSVIRSKGTKLQCVKTLNDMFYLLICPLNIRTTQHTAIAPHFMWCLWRGQKKKWIETWSRLSDPEAEGQERRRQHNVMLEHLS